MRRVSRLLTIEAAAGRLAASRRTIYRLADRGILEIVHLDADLPRVREADVDRLIESGGGR